MGMFGDRRRWRSKDPKRETRWGGSAAFAGLRALVILMFGILILQLINLQVLRGEEFRQQAEINALREVTIPASRGLIYDRNGELLVQNAARFSAAILPGDLPDRGATGVYRLISSVIDMPVEEIDQRVEEGIIRQGHYSPAVIKEDIDRDTALILLELEPHAPGLRLLIEPSRNYLTDSLLSHILGFIGPISAEEWEELRHEGYEFQDFVGKSGVELAYEAKLRGKPGKKLIEVDAAGRELRVISERRPVDGMNMVLSIDLELQRQVTEVLEHYAAGSEHAAASVMDVRTGDVLSLVSLPSFDNNIFSRAISDEELQALLEAPGKPLVNHAIAERYAPGSVFKTIVGAAALQEEIAFPWTTIHSSGYITVENEFDPNVVYVYPDWAPLGDMDFYQGLAMSSNVYFYYLAGGRPEEGFRGLGEERVAQYARAFGLGGPTGIDLTGESPGLVPDAPWKEETVGDPWTLGDTYNFGIGQGYVAVTPLQMVRAAAAIANGGDLLTPRLVREYRDSHDNSVPAEEAPRTRVPVQDEYLQVVREAMRRSVTDGIARDAAVSGIPIAGKTGTAEFGTELFDGSHETHGWFIGFAPYDDPQVAIVVFVQRGGGGDEAAPAAGRMLEHYFSSPHFVGRTEDER